MSLSARRSRRAATLGAALLGLCAPRAEAMHPLPSPGRPLHLRLAEADRVAFASVAAIDLGRIRFRSATAVIGNVDSEFELKRSPSAPPPLREGDRALLLLRGARSPFVLVDMPRELVSVDDADSEVVLTRAVLQLGAASAEPSALLRLYLEWLDGPHPALRSWARLGLLDPQARFAPLPDAVIAARVRVALDPRAHAAARATSATLAVTSERGTAALIARVPGTGDAADPAVTSTALTAALLDGNSDLLTALLRALRHPDGDIRRAGVRFSRQLAVHPEPVARELERMAREETDPPLRKAAERARASRAVEATGETRNP